jgi:RNA polymerase-binding transcription factor DksA
MHKLAFQDAKLKLFRKANKKLTNRRKTKKKQLRKKGLYSFQDAKKQLNAEALDAQIQQKTRNYNGLAKRVETRARRYGKCGKTGHNIKTCDIELESSEG